MKIRSPSLPELHAFARAAETGSFVRAAQLLCVTQAAVSRAVLRLEARVGTTLLERNPRGVSLTPGGRAYLTWIQPALTILEDAAATSFQAPGQMLRISASPMLNMRWLVPRLPSFQAQHPTLRLAFQGYDKADNFLRDDVDCWLQSRTSASGRWPRHVQATYVIGRDIIAICHPGQAGRILTPQDFLRLPLLYHARYPDNWALWCRKAGIDAPAPRLEVGFDTGIVEAVMAGMGAAVIQCCLIERELALQRVAAPLSVVASTGRGYYFCTTRASAERPILAAFRQWLLEQAEAGPLRSD